MKIQFLYSSKSGNTKRLVEGLASKMNPAVEAVAIETMAHLPQADLYVVGSWIDKAKPNGAVLDKLSLFDGKPLYMVATLAADKDSDHSAKCLEHIAEASTQAKLIGSQMVQGSLAPSFIEWMATLPEDNPHALTPKKKARYDRNMGRPNQDDIEDAWTHLDKSISEWSK